MLTIACVYRSGGDYTERDVQRLISGIAKHTTIPFDIQCLTDESLEHDWPYWWAKMELFKIPGPVLYFDLDTLIVGNIDGLAHAVETLPQDSLMMLRGFYRDDECSGIMGWSGDMSWIYKEFKQAVEANGHFKKEPHATFLISKKGSWRGDQEYIRETVKKAHKPIIFAQDIALGIYSFKVHVKTTGVVPEAARVICFHGIPRPSQVDLTRYGL